MFALLGVVLAGCEAGQQTPSAGPGLNVSSSAPPATPTIAPSPSPAATAGAQSTATSAAQSSVPVVSSAPAANQSQPPTSPPPGQTPSSVPNPASTISIVQSDLGKTFNVGVGTRLSLDYETPGLTWTNTFDTAILQASSPTLLVAIAKGRTELQSTGRPVCRQGEACPQFIAAFRVTIVVG